MQIFSELVGINSLRHALETLRITEKLKFFNFWIVLMILGSFFQFFSGVLAFLDSETVLLVHEVFVGFGCYFAWIGLIQFLDHKSHSYTIVNTVDRAIGTIGPYIVGIVPIFMGYAFCGMCVFWATGTYPTTTLSMIANYALVNGDSVYAFSSAGYQDTAIIGQLYYYSFIVFFIW